MAHVFADRVADTTSTTGTGAFALDNEEPTGYQNFDDVCTDADTIYYAASHALLDEWEVGLGTFGAGTNILTRTTVLASSNAGSAVNFSGGTKHLFGTFPASALGAFNASVRAITSADTVIASDRGRIITVSGYFTLALTAAATLGSGFGFELRNIGTRRVLIDPSGAETIDGAPTLGIYPGQSCKVFCNGTAFFTVGLSPRWRLTAATTIYVATTGTTTDDGLAVGSPITVATAQTFLRNSVEQGGNNVIIQLADGTYNTAAGFSQFAGHQFGHHNIEIHGNSGAPTNVILAPTNSGENALYVSDYARVILRYVKIQGHASCNPLVVEQHGVLGIDTVEIASCNVAIRATIGGNFKTNGAITVSGTHGQTLQATHDGMIELGASAHQVSNGFASSFFAVSTAGLILVDSGATISGAGFAGATGQRFLVRRNGVIDTSGSGDTFFPGNVNGEQSDGGRYF